LFFIRKDPVDINLTIAITAAAVAITALVITALYRARELKERRRGERRAEIKTRLYEFYGPLAAHLNVVAALYKLLATSKPEGFDALSYLLDPYREYQTESGVERVVLNDLDRRLLEEIVSTEKQIEALVLAKAGLDDDGTLLFVEAHESRLIQVPREEPSPFTQALAHFRLLRLAYSGHFEGNPALYMDFDYPQAIETHIKERIAALHAELEKLGR
jgi:hypothetical protein